MSEEDDERYFEDFTVSGELENLVKQLCKDGECEFRGIVIKLEKLEISRNVLLNSLDFFSFTQEIPMLFNIDKHPFFRCALIEDSNFHYLTVSSAKFILSVMNLAFPKDPCFVKFGKDASLIIGRHGKELYSLIPDSLSTYPKKCSAMISLTLSMPYDRNWRPSFSRDHTIVFPTRPAMPPIRRYLLKGIFPQIDSQCITDGLDPLIAPIILLSAIGKIEIISQSEVFFSQLSESCSRALQPLQYGVNEHDINAKTKLRSICVPPSSRFDRLLSFIFILNQETHPENLCVRLFKALFSCLYDLLHAHLNKSAMSIFSGLWMEYVRGMRELWDGRISIDVNEDPNWDEPLVFQKLSVIGYCIAKSLVDTSDSDEQSSPVEQNNEETELEDRRGVRKPLGKFMQNFPDREIMIPFTQSHDGPGVLTSDNMAHYQLALQKYPLEERNRLHARPLLSDMQSFKAANPGCTLIDFCQWHSPKDIVVNGDAVNLSERMKGGIWAELWEEARPIPCKDQPLLFDVQKEAEKALFYLEDLSLSELLQQLIDYFPSIFDIKEEHRVIASSLLVKQENTESLIAQEEERDRVQLLFKENISNLYVEEQCFGFSDAKTMIVKRKGKGWVARVE